MVTKAQGVTGGAALTTAGVGAGIALTNKDDESSLKSLDSQSTNHESAETSYEDSLGAIGLQTGITVLSLETNFSVDYSNTVEKQTVGGLYGGYLIGTYGKSDSNKDWWDKSYKVWENDKGDGDLSNEFKKGAVDSAFVARSTGGSNKALNKVCESIYKKETKEIDFKNYKYEEKTDDNKKKLVRDTMKYCSPMGRIPKTVGEAGESSYGEGSIGLIKKDILASVTDTLNNVFWKLRSDDFFRNNSNYWSGTHLVSSLPEKLKKFYESRSGSSENPNIKDACKDIYSLSNSDSKASTYVYYCSWNSTT